MNELITRDAHELSLTHNKIYVLINTFCDH